MKAMSREQLEALVEQVAEQLLQIPPPNSYWELGIGYREWAADRARNIVAGLGANYMVVPLPAIPEFRGDRNAPEGSWIGLSSAPDWRTPLISDAPRHMFGCRCGKCPGEWMPVLDGLRTERPAGVVSYHGWSCMCSTCADAKQKERQ